MSLKSELCLVAEEVDKNSTLHLSGLVIVRVVREENLPLDGIVFTKHRVYNLFSEARIALTILVASFIRMI